MGGGLDGGGGRADPYSDRAHIGAGRVGLGDSRSRSVCESCILKLAERKKANAHYSLFSRDCERRSGVGMRVC